MAISNEQKKKVIHLYEQQHLTIKQIMDAAGIGSTQTVYRILDDAGVSKINRRSIKRATISFDEQTWDIIKRYNPINLSKWICKIITNNHDK